MPSKAAHLAVAAQNQRSIDYLLLEGNDHLRWIVTITFYKALHIVEAVFANDPNAPARHTDDHVSRNHILRTHRRYAHLWRHYHPLFNASLVARYLRMDESATEYEDFALYMDLATVRSTVLNHHLHQIEQSAAKLLGTSDLFGIPKPPSDS